MKPIRICFISDLHCGHRVGLTPPEYQSAVCGYKFYKTQMVLWNWYVDNIKAIKPQILVVNGDAIDGRGERSGSTELIAVSRIKQCEMAGVAISVVGADEVYMTRGTPYHVGNAEEFEDIIKQHVEIKKIEDHAWYDINGVVFDVKHMPGGTSGVPHTAGTGITMDHIWNTFWANHNKSQPLSHVTIRSHTHSFSYHGFDNWLGVLTPALQGMGSKYGAKACRKLIHFGFIYFDVYENGEYTWNWRIAKVEEQQAKAIKLA